MKTPDSTKAESSAPNTRKFSGKSTATEAQYDRVLHMLRQRNHNTMELRRNGVMMPAARIKELNERYGYTIDRVDQISIWDEWGFRHNRVAVYGLIREPESDHAANRPAVGLELEDVPHGERSQ